MSSDLETLGKAAILEGLRVEDLDILLRQCHRAHFEPNETVVEDSTTGREIYIVLKGEVAVTLDPAKFGTIERGSIDSQVLRRIRPGGSFGEIAFLTGELRTASVVATCPGTELLVIPYESFDELPKSNMILRNLACEVAHNLRTTNERMIAAIISGYFLTALVEELATGTHVCSPVAPLEKLVVVRHEQNFVLSGPDRLLPGIPDKEVIEIAFFSEPATLRALAGDGAPSGAVVFNALWSILRAGSLSERIPNTGEFRFETSLDRRTGALTVQKSIDGRTRAFHMEWEIKGARYDARSATTRAFLHLAIHEHPEASRAQRAERVVAGIAMPVLKHVRATVPRAGEDFRRTRVVVIHHRTHEVARTLESLEDFGFQIHCFIGIPYGDIDWEYVTMLDHVSRHKYLCLKLVPAPVDARYEFDFRQSSFLDSETEEEFYRLYSDPANSTGYLAAMEALAENRLIDALTACQENGEQLIIYEDGGYVASKVYEIYGQPAHPAHRLVKSSVEDGRIRGIVEVTVAGERKNIYVIERNGGRALLPVLSNARSDVKAAYEAKGVGEAVLSATATSLGRLGLPTFQTRRIACIGGNGAIGSRLVEQLAAVHNSTSNIFVVDVSELPFRISVDAQASPHAAARLQQKKLPRYQVTDDCYPVRLHAATDGQAPIAEVVHNFLGQEYPYRELALAAEIPTAGLDVTRVLPQLRLISTAALLDGEVCSYQLQHGDRVFQLSLLPASTVFTFSGVSRLIRSGIDTVIGSTGLSIFSAGDIDEFFARPNPTSEVDELVLISASSKDNEFRNAVEVLNCLTKLQSRDSQSLGERMELIADLYRYNLSVLQEEGLSELRPVFANAIEPQSLPALSRAAASPAERSAVLSEGQPSSPELLVDFVSRKIESRLTIRKEIRPDIGSVYLLAVMGQHNRVVLLADGLVINFFARHEKGVKTEFIDPVVTMQMLSVVKLATERIQPGLHRMESFLSPNDVAQLWSAIDENCRPLQIT